MKTFLFFIFGMLFCFPFSKSAELDYKLSEGCIEYSSNLYTEVAKMTSSNLLISPLSLKMALGMIASGAKNNTYKEIIKLLNIKDESEVVDIVRNLTDSIPPEEGVPLITANKVYIGDLFEINASYLKEVADNFKSEIQTISFSNPEKAAIEINKWIADNTKDKIKNMFSPKELNSGTTFVLVNALYFHDSWLYEFNKTNTRSEFFYVNATRNITVEMMHAQMKTEFHFDPEMGFEFLRLPYKNKDIAMYLAVPFTPEKVLDLDKNIRNILRTTVDKPRSLKVEIPKFVIENSNPYESVLENIGMKESFRNEADFSGMLDPETKSIKIDMVRQNTFIEVDEKGTTGAATSGTGYEKRTGLRSFVANRPFIFYIKYKGELLFLGRFCSR